MTFQATEQNGTQALKSARVARVAIGSRESRHVEIDLHSLVFVSPSSRSFHLNGIDIRQRFECSFDFFRRRIPIEAPGGYLRRAEVDCQSEGANLSRELHLGKYLKGRVTSQLASLRAHFFDGSTHSALQLPSCNGFVLISKALPSGVNVSTR